MRLSFLCLCFAACAVPEPDPLLSGGPDGGGGELSAACRLLAGCCPRWPEDLRRSCSGPAEVTGENGESGCRAMLANLATATYCPELDVLSCSAELRAAAPGICVPDAGPGPTDGLETFTPSNLGPIQPPAGVADVTVASANLLCEVDTATGSGPCLSGANRFVAMTVQGFDVLFARSLVVEGRTLLMLRGARPAIIVATETIDVRGGIDVGWLGRSSLDTALRPGALTGGPGVGGTWYGGGGFCGKGGGGFNGASMGGAAYGNAALVPLTGGSRGANTMSGAGAGALQLVAGRKITVAGLINATGQEGFRAPGGSGGAVLLEAPVVEGAGQIVASGGKGAPNVNTDTGGGTAGAGAQPNGGDATVAYASGGGGAGRIRINAKTMGFGGTLDPAEASGCATKGSLAPR